MAANRTITITIAGDSKPAQKAFKDAGASAEQMEVKVEGAGKAFEDAFRRIGLQAAAIGLVTNAMRQGIAAVGDYNTKVDSAERTIHALTQSNQAVAQAQAIANREVEAGRTAYSDTIQAIATLTPIAQRTGVGVEQLFHTVQLLATLNSGPEGGVEGAIVAISEALAGDWTSAIRRFNLPRQEINQLKAQGVPALQILTQVLAEQGVTYDAVTESSKSAANQQHIFSDNVARLAATMGDPAFEAFNEALTKLNQVASQPGALKFFQDFGDELRIILAGKLFDELTVEWEQMLYVFLKSYDNFLRGISGGKLHLVGFDLQSFYNEIEDQKGKIQAAIQSGVTKPAADELSGKSNSSPVAPEKVAGYGADLLRAYISGFQSPQLDALDQFSQLVADKFQNDPAGLQQVQSLFAAAISEITEFGQISNGTFGPSEGMLGQYTSTAGQATNTVAALTAALGDQAPQVLQLLEDYRQTTIAQTNLAVATATTAAAQQHLSDVQAAATADLAGYQQAVDDATAAQQAHQRATEDATQAIQDQISAAQDAADAQARATQAELDTLNNQLATLQQVQQAHQAAAQARAGLEQAVLAGETDEYLKQLDVIDDQTRAIAAKWEAEIGGARRAQSATSTKVTQEERAQRAQILKYDEQIAAARENGDTAAVKRLQKQKDDYQKTSDQQLQLDRERAAVAQDRFDSKKEQLDKENKGIKENDDAQAKADRAAIDGQQQQIRAVQDRQKQEQQAAQDRQRQLQAELTSIQRNAKEQARADQDAITAAQNRYTERQQYWKQETDNAQQAVKNAQTVETSMKNTADAAQKLLDLETKRFKLYQDNGVNPGATGGTPPPFETRPGQGPVEGQPGEVTPPAPTTTVGAGANQPITQKTTPPPADLKPIPATVVDGNKYAPPPPGYHSERAPDGSVWYVPDGHDISEYGQLGTPTAPTPGTSGPTAASIGGFAARNILDTGSAATSGTAGAPLPPINVNTTVHVHGNASASDAKRIGDAAAAATASQMRRVMAEVLRGGARQTVTTPRTA